MKPTLVVRAEHRLPLSEVSGLAVRTVDGAREVLAVGDDSPVIVVADLIEQSGSRPSARRVDVGGAVTTAWGEERLTEWEAIAADGAGRVFVLREPGEVLVFDAALTRVKHLFTLDLARALRRGHSRSSLRNSGGEGLVLLPGGHLLVAQQKEPALLLELGPPGEKAVGVTADGLVRGRQAFDVPAGCTSELVVLAVWRVVLPGKSTDSNDLAIDDEGSLYVLSAPGRLVVRVRLPLRPEDSSTVPARVWRLPATLGAAEGLLPLAEGVFLVAFDRRTKGPVYELVGRLGQPT